MEWDDSAISMLIRLCIQRFLGRFVWPPVSFTVYYKTSSSRKRVHQLDAICGLVIIFAVHKYICHVVCSETGLDLVAAYQRVLSSKGIVLNILWGECHSKS